MLPGGGETLTPPGRLASCCRLLGRQVGAATLRGLEPPQAASATAAQSVSAAKAIGLVMRLSWRRSALNEQRAGVVQLDHLHRVARGVDAQPAEHTLIEVALHD